MAERFIRGWQVDVEKLYALVGSDFITAEDVLDKSADLDDLLMTLGEGDEEEGRGIAEEALTQVLGGELDPEHPYQYARVTEALLDACARRLPGVIDMVTSYYLDSRSHGVWNPVLRIAGLDTLAEYWAKPNFKFPWPADDAPDVHWPTFTLIEGEALVSLKSELAVPTDLTKVGDEHLGDYPEDSATEMMEGLTTLKAWTDAALASPPMKNDALSAEGNALLLLMDGDQ